MNTSVEDTVETVAKEDSTPLCLDLDGTLIRTDLFVESTLALLRNSPGKALKIPFWLIKGKAYAKEQIAGSAEVRADLLPYNLEVIEMARSARQRGQSLVLATASNRKYANQVAEHLDLFDAVYASDETTNLSAVNKANLLEGHYGRQGFDYVGNSRKDLQVWRQARRALVVEPEMGVLSTLRKQGRNADLLGTRKSRISALLSALRPHQWLKNLIVLLPLLTAHLYTDIPSIFAAVMAVVAFSLMASAGYVINDLLDLEADRQHVRKRKRPFASGDLPISLGLVTIPALVVAALAVSWWLPTAFLFVISLYLVVTLSYSLYLKSKTILDVIVLAGLYTLRVIGGAAAIAVAMSFWLLAFSMFLFLSLAFIKRFSELKGLDENGRTDVAGRGYATSDLDLVRSLGVSAGYGAVVVLALYVNSPEIVVLYSEPKLIWLICPVLLYWLAHTWMMAHRGLMHDDPLVFAIRDRVSQVSVVLAALIVYLAV